MMSEKMGEEFPSWLQEMSEETLETRSEGIRLLRIKLHAGGKDLWVPVDDANFLLRFLRFANFDLQTAFDRVLKYNDDMRSLVEHNFKMSHQDLLPFFERDIIGLVPARADYTGPRILYAGNMDKWDTSFWSAEDAVQGFVVAMEKLLCDPVVQVQGITIVVDAKHFSFRQFLSIMRTPSLIFKSASLIQSILPMKMEGFYYYRANRFLQKIADLFWYFLNENLRQRMLVLGDENELHKHVGKDNLPLDVGGTLPLFNNREFIEKLTYWQPAWIEHLREAGK